MKIAIYSRKSKETDTGESIKNQIRMCKEYFTRQYDDCTFEIFEDEGFSGGNTNRPAFKRMMQLAKHKQFDIIAAYRIDRIGRNTLDFLMMFEELKQYDIKLISVTEGFDPDTPAGKMMMSMLSSMAEMERMNIAQRIKDNMTELAKMGRWSGGTPPTGYKSITNVNSYGKKETYLDLIPEMEEKIKYIFKRAAEGYTTFQIGKETNLSSKTVYNILTNPVYVKSTEESAKYLESLGYLVYGELNGLGFMPYNRRPKKSGKKLFNATGMFVSVSKHNAIIDAPTWIKANSNISNRGQESRPRISPNSFLSHLIKCSCGNNMFVHQGRANSSGEKVYYFRCSAQKNKQNDCTAKWLKVSSVEESVLKILESFALDKKTLEKFITSKKDIDYDSLIKDVKKDIGRKNKDIEKLTEKLILIEGPAVKIVTSKINELSKEIDNLNSELLSLERKKIFQEQDKININTLHSSIIKLVNHFHTLPIEDKQTSIRGIIKEIRFNGNDEIEVVLVGGI